MKAFALVDYSYCNIRLGGLGLGGLLKLRCVRGWWLLKSQTLCRRKKRELAPVLSRRAVFEYRKLPSRKFLCAAQEEVGCCAQESSRDVCWVNGSAHSQRGHSNKKLMKLKCCAEIEGRT